MGRRVNLKESFRCTC